ncbi:TIGR01777 family protein [Glaciecola sp. MH2013]|uniref:TIGR01777 family oxidoreductase n=1 Tax=Glaciecola sp. MH2013 TaxID=2785524 RepID=UPI0018A04BA3|nr:TIGR01777 family oxidoreductase [Glaciecola sp. MH2013]MBF7073145.1 TIGR01777 family protein [Glaciecola sp. MH2013]
MTQHILITGGTGLIGRQLIEHLRSSENGSGLKLSVLTRDPSRAKRLLGHAAEYVSNEDLNSVDEYTIIINLAGEPIADKRWTDAQKKRICESRWGITEKLVELIDTATTPPHTFISGSAIGVYGRQGDSVITESYTDFYDEFSREVCQKWEDIALRAETKTRVCILRTGVVLSDQGGALAKMLMPFRLGLGGPIGSGKQFMAWIHINDMIGGIQFLVDNEKLNGIFNFTAPNPNTNHFFSLALARRLERPCIFKVPAFVLRTLMGESSDLVLYGQKVIPQRLLDEGYAFQYPVLKDALAGLDL